MATSRFWSRTVGRRSGVGVRGRVAFVAAVGVLLATAAVVPAASRGAASVVDQACFYENTNFLGSSECVPLGGTTELVGIAASSVQLVDNGSDGILPSVELYDQDGFGGEMITLSADNADLGTLGWNDRALSAKVVAAPSVCLFQKVDFDTTGASTCLPLGATADLSHLVRSVRIDAFNRFSAAPPDTTRDVGGLVVTLYDGLGETGHALPVYATTSDLGVRAWRDKAKSVRVTRFSCLWNTLKLSWPLRGDSSKEPWYDNPYYGAISRYLPLDPAPGGLYTDFMGNLQTYHNGVDMVTFSYRETYDDGAEVHAAAAGVVVGLRDGLFDQDGGSGDADEWMRNDQYPFSVPGMTDWNGNPVADGSGNVVFIQHPNGFITQYAHLKIGVSTHVRLGQWVPAGALLGTAASSGASSGPHLHFGVYVGKECQATQPTWFGFDGDRTAQPSGRISRVQADTANTGAMVEAFYREPDGSTPGGTTMWTGPISPYKPMDPAGEPALRRFYQFAVNAVPLWYHNPADNITSVPVGQPVRWLAYVWGNTDTVEVKVTDPNGVAVDSGGPFAASFRRYSFVPSVPGTYTIQGIANDQTTGNPVTQFTEQIQAFSAPTLKSLKPVAVSTESIRAGARVKVKRGKKAKIGETAALDTKQAALVQFPPLAANTTYAIARLHLAPGGIQGVTPFGEGSGTGLNGFGWGGRLYADVVDATGHVLMAKVAQFNAVPLFPDAWSPGSAPDPDAPNWSEAVIDPAAFPLLAQAGVALRISFERTNNLSDNVDSLTFDNYRLATSSS